ncbi:ATP-binding protein [Allomesorhizobium alhagi]|uniref:ATP-binding protein n=1 Tax=Allomesorhizobium alhagi TaxID=475067 RepID=UPI001FCC633D|nr:ATP-binding protein [Mesorhizobium alhagi]
MENQFSKSHPGSGLGLAISRSLAEWHGGALKIRSTEGVGTIVSVRIPSASDRRRSKPPRRVSFALTALPLTTESEVEWATSSPVRTRLAEQRSSASHTPD